MAIREVEEMMATVEEMEEVVYSNLVKRLRAAKPLLDANIVDMHLDRRAEAVAEMASWTGPDSDVDSWTESFNGTCQTLLDCVARQKLDAEDGRATLEKVRVLASKRPVVSGSIQLINGMQKFEKEHAVTVMMPAVMAHAELQCFSVAHLFLKLFHPPLQSVSEELQSHCRKIFFEQLRERKVYLRRVLAEQTEAYRTAKTHVVASTKCVDAATARASIVAEDEFMQCVNKLSNILDVLETRMHDAEEALCKFK